MRRAGNPSRALAAGLLALALSAWLSGCEKEPRPSQPGSAGLQVHLVFPDRQQDSTAGTASVQSIRVSAWELPGVDVPRVLRDSTTAAIAPGETRFRLVLQVPPATLYLLQVEAKGTLSPTAAGTGLLYFGADSVANVRAGETRTVEIQLQRVVPLVTGQATTTSLTLHWDPVDGALRYGLLEIPPPPALPRETFTRSTDTLIVFPVQAKPAAPEQRTYRVRAELPDSLFTGYSESIGVSVPGPIRPAAIEDLIVAHATATELRLEWTATGDDSTVGQARAYDLRRSGLPIDSGAAFAAATRIEGVPAPQTAGLRERFLVTGLDPATDYYFAIKARDDVPLWSPLSNTARGTTLPLPPAAPQDLAAETLSDTAIALHWTDLATNEAGYRIQRQSPTDPRFVLADTMIGSFTGTVTYRDGGLTERTSYRYRVRAENAGGNSAWSNEVVQRTRITRPTNLAAIAMAPDSVALTWRFPLPDPARGFRVERRTGSGGFAQIGRPAAADRAFGDGGVQPLTTYAYRLRAADVGDVSDPSDSVSAPSDSVEVTTPDLPPVCQVEVTTLAFDTVFVGSSLDRAFLITNTGGGTLTGNLATTCPAFSIITGGGDFSLDANHSWQVVVRFSPRTPGAKRCVIVPASGCEPVVCTGTGEAVPACTVDPPEVEFGIVPMGSSVERSFTITNSGGGILTGNVALVACPGFGIVAGGGDFTLGANDTQVVTLRFSPTSPGVAQCVLTPTGGCASVNCSGTGEALPLCSIDPTSLDFGTVPIGTNSIKTFTITNAGGGTLSGSVEADCGDYYIDGGSGPFSLGAGVSDTVTIRFAPSVEQLPGCTVNLGVTGCSSVSCTGAGEAHPICSLDPARLDFGFVRVGTSVDRSFTITNTGGGQLPVIVGTSCDKDISVVIGTGTVFLGTGQTRQVTVRFAPQDTTASSCLLNLRGTTNVGCLDDLPITGTGQGPICSVSTTSLDFGTVEVGGSATQTFTVTNIGGGILTGMIAWRMCASSNFAIETGSGVYNLGPGVSRTVTVAYAPHVAGVDVCQLATDCTDVTCNGTAPDPNDHWWPGFSGNAPNYVVRTLALHDSKLAVGGSFTAIGNAPTGFLAWWSGSSWTTSNDPTWTDVHVLQTWAGPLGNGSLVAAGYASNFSGITVAERLFDGPDPYWQFMGAQFQGGAAEVLANWQNNLYVGGSFAPGPQLSFWDGAAWVEADQGLSGFSVNDLEAFGGTLYAAGSYVVPAGGSSGAIFRLNGSSWTVVTSTLNGSPLTSVQKLATHAGALYAIVEVGTGSSVVRLQGTTLVTVGDADDGVVVDIASGGTRLYAIGTFDRLGGVYAEQVAAWDGLTWHALGSGIPWGLGSPAVILSFGGDIYVGGNFTTAGGKDSPYIARWIP